MIGVFVQVNERSINAIRFPVGYVIQENGCWEWVGAKNQDGYGLHSIGHHRNKGAHRWMYERSKGPIPRGLTLDHLCRNRACVNPDHLEPTTNKENVLRGIGITAMNRYKTHCPRGHEYRKDYRGYRVCQKCHYLNAQARGGR